ncbi:MAG: hypothetical protein IKW66_00515, partial [Clostridia bacterium]|nr:hypothetical protein [Clostridia bacterium]
MVISAVFVDRRIAHVTSSLSARIKKYRHITAVSFIYYTSKQAENQYKTATKGVIIENMMYISSCKERCVMLGTYLVE